MFSWIIQGQLSSVEYQEDSASPIYKKWHYITTSSQQYQMQQKADVGLKQLKCHTYSSNDCYLLDKHTLHKIDKISKTGAITAILTFEQEEVDVSVYSQQRDYELDNQCLPLSQQQIYQRLTCFKQAFDKLVTNEKPSLAIHE